MDEAFYNDFSPLSNKGQFDLINQDLQKLNLKKCQPWVSPEGIEVSPIFCPSAEDQSAVESNTPWSIGHPIEYSTDHAAVDQQIKLAIDFETDTLIFNLNNSSVDCRWLANRIKREEVDGVFIRNQGFSEEEIAHLSPLSNCTLCSDYLGYYLQQPSAREHILAKTQTSIQQQTVYVDAALYANAGATTAQQISYALLHLNEYLHALALTQFSSPIHLYIRFAQGSNYFFEIAKLKAFRQLVGLMLGEYSFTATIQLLATPQFRNKTTSDFNGNLLRSTTEVMSAILGGADVVMNYRYDKRFNVPNDFGNRIALNQLQLLKHESYFDQLPNVTQGTYYLNYLIKELKETAWNSFLEHERAGGWLKEVQCNSLQQKVQQAADQELNHLKNGSRVLVGSTAYFDPSAPSASLSDDIGQNATKIQGEITPLTICYLE